MVSSAPWCAGEQQATSIRTTSPICYHWLALLDASCVALFALFVTLVILRRCAGDSDSWKEHIPSSYVQFMRVMMRFGVIGNSLAWYCTVTAPYVAVAFLFPLQTNAMLAVTLKLCAMLLSSLLASYSKLRSRFFAYDYTKHVAIFLDISAKYSVVFYLDAEEKHADLVLGMLGCAVAGHVIAIAYSVVLFEHQYDPPSAEKRCCRALPGPSYDGKAFKLPILIARSTALPPE